LQSGQTADDAELQQSLKGLIQDLTLGFSQSTTEETTVTQGLTQALQTVLTDLGSPSSRSGVLGFVSDSASNAAASSTNLNNLDNFSGQFSTSQQDELGIQALAAAQIFAGLTEAKHLTAFQVRQPPSSAHVSIYIYTLNGG
jgi:hypothetical protein